MAEGEGLNKNRFSEQQAVKERLLLTLEQLKARLEQAQKVNEAGNEEKERLKGIFICKFVLLIVSFVLIILLIFRTIKGN